MCAMLTDALSSNRLRMADLVVDDSEEKVIVRLNCKWESPKEISELPHALSGAGSGSSSVTRSNSVVDQALAMMMLYKDDKVFITSDMSDVLQKLRHAVSKAEKVALSLSQTFFCMTLEKQCLLSVKLCVRAIRYIFKEQLMQRIIWNYLRWPWPNYRWQKMH